MELPQLGADPSAPFPPIDTALQRPNGLLAWGGGLEPRRLLAAYRLGIFPWYSEGEPILWWSPAPRCVIYPPEVHLSRRTRRRFAAGAFTLSLDRAFEQVIDACAAPRANSSGTWITAALRASFVRLHRQGFAHSLEVWQQGELAGGIYGLALGRVFFGESMFSRVTDGSKMALVALCRHLQAHGYGLLDCQVPNDHLHRMGAVEISRKKFARHLDQWVHQSQPAGCWSTAVAGVHDQPGPG